MARKPSPRQVSFESLLEPNVGLDKRVILVDEPRWPQALRDLAAAPFCGLDLEFYSDAASSGGDVEDVTDDDSAGIDPWTCTIRLIQAALPDGRVLVADLGGVGDDRAARLRLYGDCGDTETVTVDGEVVTVPIYRSGSFFDVLRDLVESETRAKILHHAKIDSLLLRIRMGWRLRGARCTMLASQLYYAGIRNVRHGLGALSERAVAAGAPGVWLVEKRLQRSEWRWRLSNAQVNYGALDAAVVIPLFKWIGGLIAEAGMTAACQAEFAAIAGFVDCEYHGMPVNPAMLDDHIEMWRRGRELAIEPFRERYPGVDPAKTQVVAVALSLDDCYGGYRFYELDEEKPRRHPVYILGQRFDHAFRKHDERYGDAEHTVAEAVLSRWATLPWVSALLDWRSMGVVLKWLESIRRRLHRDGRVRGEYAQIAGGEGRNSDSDAGKGMGRSACIAKGTRIEVVRDVSKFPQGIPIEEVKEGDLVYCFDANNDLRIRKVLRTWSSGRKNVVRVTWQGGGHQKKGHLDLTPEHLVRLSTGQYVRADQLKFRHRVCALSRGPANGGYMRLWVTGDIEIAREHRFVYEQTTGKTAEHVHHINHNKLDNRPANLVGMSEEEHLRLHGAYTSPELRETRSINGRVSWYRNETANRERLQRMWGDQRLTYSRDEVEAMLSRNGWSITRTLQETGHDGESFRRLMVDVGLDIKDVTERSRQLDMQAKRGKGYNLKPCRKCGEKHFNIQKCPKPPANNHEILAVTPLADEVEVFDITVEDCENFIANEICVHNCRAPSLQQSANPQPKLSRLIHDAMGFTGDTVPMSPRMPFVGHDEYAVSYLRWAAARLRGEAEDPFRSRQDVRGGAGEARQGGSQGDAAAQPLSVVWGDLDEVEAGSGDDLAAQQPDALARAAWYEQLADEWAARPRGLVVADFSQAHMRIAAEASRDPQLLEDFQCDRDAHLKLAYDFGVATGQVPADLPIEAFFAWYDKKHPKHKFVKSLRQPAKTGNYTSLNLGSVARLKGAGDTAKPPILLTYEQWEIIRDAWRKRYVGLFTFQKQHIRRCNAVDVVIDGSHYGAAWELAAGARLWLRKEVDKYDREEPEWCASCGRTHGRLTVKGTDAVSFVWMRTEASAIKHAMGDVLADFDRHDAYFMARRLHPRGDVWAAHMGVMCHDELDATARKRRQLAVAACVRRHFAAGLRWAGLRDVPPEPGDAKDSDLIVRSWADK